MGLRHGAILSELGDDVEFQDIGYYPPEHDLTSFQSALICTPPETHLSIIKQFNEAMPNLPLFIEKPVIVDKLITPFTNSTTSNFKEITSSRVSKSNSINIVSNLISMVACNWRFCPCFSGLGRLVIGYQANKQYDYLDLIHFVDLFMERYGQPAQHGLYRSEDYLMLYLAVADGMDLEVRFFPTANAPFCYVPAKTPNHIHQDRPCQMFYRQMVYWRSCLERQVQTLNPIEKALERTNWLIKLAMESGIIPLEGQISAPAGPGRA